MDPMGTGPLNVDDVVLGDLCRQSVAAKHGDPNDFPGSCVRLKDHKGRCQKIDNGMSEAEARAITEQDIHAD